MNIAYLIKAHNNPKHLQRLITALSTGSSRFFIHIDKKSNVDDFLNINGNNILFTQRRVPVFYFDFSHVEATLILLQTALADGHHFDRFVYLSGVDYPLRSASYIEQFFENNPDKEFINLVAMPSEAAGKPISRLTTYKLRPGDPTITRIIRKALLKVGLLSYERNYKTYLRDLTPYGGSEWWAFSREASDYILAFVKEEIQVINFFKNTLCPNESLFQTILGNSQFRSRIVRNLTYADWSAGGHHPANITEKYLAFFQSISSFPPDDVYGGGEMLFARKFSDESEGLVKRLDKQIEEKDVQHFSPGVVS